MYAYIKDRKTFATKKKASIISYDIAVDSVDNSKSTVVLEPGSLAYSNQGDWLVIGGYLLYISALGIDDDSVTVTCLDIINAFGRDLILSSMPTGITIAGFISGVLTQEWKNQSDAEYAMPYLTVSASGTTSYVPPTTDSDGVFNFSDYLNTCSSVYGVKLSYSIGVSTLAITVSQPTSTDRTVLFNTGDNQLNGTPSFSLNSVAKITVMQNGSVYSHYYLHPDGSFSQTATNRSAGSWELMIAGDTETTDDIIAKVAEKFKSGLGTHKIEFYSVNEYSVGDRCRFRIGGSSYEGQISSKTISSGDNRFLYKSGELAVTLTDKLKGVIK